MSLKTIAKLTAFVILAGFSAGCGRRAAAPPADPRSPYGPPQMVGSIKSADIDESSGLAASPCQADVLWTVNDSGDGPFVYAIRPDGGSLGKWRVPGVRNIDWEDIAAVKDAGGKCFLYIAEIGDNRIERPEHAVYRIREPGVEANAPDGDREAGPADAARFTYPDENHNAETLLVHPVTGEMYVITKRIAGPAGVYKIVTGFGEGTRPASLVAEISVAAVPPGLFTGGSISPDGKRVIVSDYLSAYEWVLPSSGNFDQMWSQQPITVDVGRRDVGEAVCYSADGRSIYSTSEGVQSPIYRLDRKKEGGR